MELWLEYLFLFGFPILWVIWVAKDIIFHKITPKPAKIINKERTRKNPLLFVARDDKKFEVKRVKVHPEGILETKEKNPEFFFLPRASVNPKDKKEARLVEETVLKPCAVEGLGSAVFFAYSGKAIATNPETLVTLQYKKKQVEVVIGKHTGNPSKFVKHVVAKILLPIHPTILKKHFAPMWNQSQVRSSNRISEEYGYEKSKKEPKTILMYMVVLGCVIIAGAVVLTMFG